nr:copia protein [Tanacetum cinerariifolium]
MAFVSSSSNNSNSSNGVNTAHGVNTANEVNTASSQVNDASSLNIDNLSDAVICAFLASQPNSTYLVNEDLEQIHPDDLEEIDLKWQIAMLTMRARRFLKNIRKKLNLNRNDSVAFDKTKVECYNCHKRDHFTRECRAPKGQHNRSRDVTRRTVPKETPNSSALVSCNGLGGYGWSDRAEEGPTNYALMAYSTSSASSLDSEVNTAKLKAAVNAAKEKVNHKAIKGKRDNVVKASACWMHKADPNYEEINKGYVAFGGNPKGGKITVKGKIKTGKLDFKNVYFVRELKFNLFSVSQICDKKNSVLFTDTECIVLSPDFKLIEENQIVLRVPRQNNMYNIDSYRRTPAIGFLRPFGCPVTILNTIDHLGSGPNWLFDIDALTKIMNYQAVVAQSNDFSGTKASNGAGKEKQPKRDYILLPLWTADSPFSTTLKREEDSTNSTNRVNTVTLNINAASSSGVNAVGTNISIDITIDTNMPSLEDIGIFKVSRDDEDVFGAEANFHNLDFTFQVSHIPTIRIHKDHPLEQVIGYLHSAPQTRKMTKNLKEHGLVGNVFPITDHKDLQIAYLLVSYIKWNPRRNKMDKRGIVTRNKAKLVAQRHTEEEGIDYDEVFAPVARIEAIRLFMAYASFKDFIVYQIDVKSAFLYGKIEEEVYACQPPGFKNLDFLDKVYKVENVLYGLHQAPRAWDESSIIKETVVDKEESSKHGRKIVDIDVDVKVNLENVIDSGVKEVAEEMVEVMEIAKIIVNEVSTAGGELNAANEKPVSAAPTNITTAQLNKSKAKLVKEPKIIKSRKAKIALDEEVARRIETEWNADMKDNIDWNEVVEQEDPKMDAERLKAPRKKTRKKKVKKDQTAKKQKGDKLEQDNAKKQKLEEQEEAEELKKNLEIVPDDEDDVFVNVTPLSSKPSTIVDYKIYKEGKKEHFQIIKANGNHQMHLAFSTILKNFDIKDLEVLWKIVKDRFKTSQPKEVLVVFLWHTLKMYLLTNYTLQQMFNEVRLQVDYEVEMACDLLRLVRKQLREGYVS